MISQMPPVFAHVFCNPDLAALIFQRCENSSYYALRATCHTLNAIGKERCPVPIPHVLRLAPVQVFRNPAAYDQLPPIAQLERRVLLNLLTKNPVKIKDLSPELPHYSTCLRTALVAAHFLHNEPLYQELKAHLPEPLIPFCREFETQRMHVRAPALQSSLWKTLPFVLYSPHADPKRQASHLEEIKPGIEFIQHHFDIALLKAQRNGLVLQWLGEELKDNPVIVEAAVKQDEDAFPFASARLQHDVPFLSSLIRRKILKLEDIDPALHSHPDLIQAAQEVAQEEIEQLGLEQEDRK